MCNECGGKGKKDEKRDVPNKEPPVSTSASKSPTRDSQKTVTIPKPKGPQPLINVLGNITGLQAQDGPVTKMKLCYKKEENKTPELNIDIDLVKDHGTDEKFHLSSESNPQEIEERQKKKLREIECELEGLRTKLETARRIRKDWNAQKEGLCNRKLKDLPVKMPKGPF